MIIIVIIIMILVLIIGLRYTPILAVAVAVTSMARIAAVAAFLQAGAVNGARDDLALYLY